jgi:hypothetical protein
LSDISDITVEDTLVPGRECGECTACCQYLSIEAEELVKLPNVKCQHLKGGGGCSIYSSRPKICDQWYCAWHSMPQMSDEWRPDKMGVMLEFCRENFPDPFTGKAGYRFTILDKEKVATNRLLAAFVGSQILTGVPCIVSYIGEPGELPTPALLNFALAQAALDKNGQAILDGIIKALDASAEQPKQYLKIEDGKLISTKPN